MNEGTYHSLRRKIRSYLKHKQGHHYRWSEYLLLVPDFFQLLIGLAVDKAVPVAEKARVGTAVAYFILPADLIPEALLGAPGYIDDLVIAAYVLSTLLHRVRPEILQKHWSGEDDVLEHIQRMLIVGEQLVGSGVYRKMRRFLNQ